MTDDDVEISDYNCLKHNTALYYSDCWNCGGEGMSHHDCGEDCCACSYPENNVKCDLCDGRGHFIWCRSATSQSPCNNTNWENMDYTPPELVTVKV